jgi:xylan 1,4-beta-xylosidase
VTERPGHLCLYGYESLGSLFRQSLVARRQQAHCYSASTVMEFEPDRFQQMAGLICYYNGSKYHYLFVSHDTEMGTHIRVMSRLPDQLQTDVFSAPLPIPAGVPVHLRVEVDFERLYFAYRIGSGEWSRMPGPLDTSTLSDEAAAPGTPNFTGPLWASDVGPWQARAGTRISIGPNTARGYGIDPFAEETFEEKEG